jgi:hypothetical protein
MDNEHDPLDFLDGLEATRRNDPSRLYAFMRACCRSLLGHSPPAAEQWLRAADEYQRGCLSAKGLETERISAWEYLGDRSCDFDSPEVNAVRAVLFLLYPDRGGDDPDLVLSHFLDFCEGAGLSREEAGMRLREAFDDLAA